MKDLFVYIWKNKSWWLLPPVIVIITIGTLVVVGASSPVSPFIYMLF